MYLQYFEDSGLLYAICVGLFPSLYKIRCGTKVQGYTLKSRGIDNIFGAIEGDVQTRRKAFNFRVRVDPRVIGHGSTDSGTGRVNRLNHAQSEG